MLEWGCYSVKGKTNKTISYKHLFIYRFLYWNGQQVWTTDVGV